MKHFTFNYFRRLLVMAMAVLGFTSVSNAQDTWSQVFFYDLTSAEAVAAGSSFSAAVADKPFVVDNAERWSFTNSGYGVSAVSDNVNELYLSDSGKPLGAFFAVKHNVADGKFRMSVNAANWNMDNEKFKFFYSIGDPATSEKVELSSEFMPAKSKVNEYSSGEFDLSGVSGKDVYFGFVMTVCDFTGPRISFADIKLETTGGGTVTPETYTVTKEVTPAEGGTVSVTLDGETDEVTEVEAGDVIVVAVEAASGYVLDGDVVVEGATLVADTENKYTVTGNVVVTANFKKEDAPVTYTVTKVVTPAEGGTVSVTLDGETDEVTEVEAGDVIVITVEAANGYVFDGEVVIEGATLVAGTEDKYTVTGNVKVTANFKKEEVPVTYTVTKEVTPAEGGTVSVTLDGETDEITEVEAGDVIVVTVEAAAGYVLDGDVVVEGATLVADTENKYTVTGNVVVTVNFKKDSSSINGVTVSEVYYNAVDEVVYADGAYVEVYDLSGCKVLAGNGTLSVSELENGVYVAVAGDTVVKFVK